MKIKYATMKVLDMDESVKYYTEVLGLDVASKHNPRPGVTITLLKGEGEAMIELIKEDHTPGKPGWFSVGMEVEDIRKKVEELKLRGAKITMEPTQIEVGMLAFLEDPNGAQIALIEHSLTHKERA